MTLTAKEEFAVVTELENEVGDAAGTQVRVDRVDDGVRVILAGDIDLACQSDLEGVLVEVAAGAAADTSIDLSGVTFLSSTGLEFLAHSTAG